MTEPTVTPNPYSPFATADPSLRHIIPVLRLLNAAPIAGGLSTTGCGQLAVVPADVIEVRPGHPFPAIACRACIAAMNADRIDNPAAERLPCSNCESLTPYPGLCILCRQERHDAWWTEQAHADAAQRAEEADIMRSAGAYDPDYGKDLDHDDETPLAAYGDIDGEDWPR